MERVKILHERQKDLKHKLTVFHPHFRDRKWKTTDYTSSGKANGGKEKRSEKVSKSQEKEPEADSHTAIATQVYVASRAAAGVQDQQEGRGATERKWQGKKGYGEIGYLFPLKSIVA